MIEKKKDALEKEDQAKISSTAPSGSGGKKGNGLRSPRDSASVESLKNVFQGVGVPAPSEEELKSELKQRLQKELQSFTTMTGITVAKVSMVRKSKVSSIHGKSFTWVVALE